ncbi:MAG: helix-turn-helix transcriptional regulator [Cellulosilyticum sp.]|nr:helix-turn-helix transcriptional regulator [Cellulosilyticum sp.]
MLIHQFHYTDVCNLIISILESSFHIHTTKISNMSTFNNEFDLKFRKIIWPHLDIDLLEMPKTKQGALYVLQSSMEFTTLLFAFPEKISSDMLIIGPFLETEPDALFLTHLLKKNGLSESLRKTFSTYYNSLPIAPSVNVISTLHQLLSFFIVGYDLCNVRYIDFSKNKPTLSDYQDDSEFYIEYHKKYKNCLDTLYNHMRLGKDATPILNDYIELTGLLRSNSIEKIKNNLYILNTQFESALLKEQLSATQVGQLSLKNQWAIESETSESKLIKLPYKMLQRYSKLFVNHNVQQYSYTISQAIEYINLNLQSNLSLSTIAKALKKNPNYLSTQFKKELGKTITKYIQERRIEEAIRMLDSTNMTIQQIAHLVGIEDLSWFSKLFKSMTHMSPTEYKEKLRCT